jgi:Ca2+-transporting ATPase
LVYWPPLQRVFGTAPLVPRDLGIAALAGSTILPIVSIEKWWRSRAKPQRNMQPRLTQVP